MSAHIQRWEADPQKVVDFRHLLGWLQNINSKIVGVCPILGPGGASVKGVGISTHKGEADPRPLLTSYTQPDYYEVTCQECTYFNTDLAKDWFVGVYYRFAKVPLGPPFTIKFTKRKGSDDSLLADNENCDVHWHGAKQGAPTTLALTAGVGQFTITAPKQTLVSIEAVPTGSADLTSITHPLRRGGLHLTIGPSF
jgi:hypothetical protein